MNMEMSAKTEKSGDSEHAAQNPFQIARDIESQKKRIKAERLLRA